MLETINDIKSPKVDNSTSLSISPFGRDITIAGKGGIWILDIEASDKDVEKNSFPLVDIAAKHHNYHTVRCEWHTFRSHGEYIAASIGSSLQLFNLKSVANPISISTGHSRTISDIEWSFLDPNLLASASVDSFVKVWDLRLFNSNNNPVHIVHHKRHAVESIMWNRKNEYTMASLHGDTVNVWDRRGGASSVLTQKYDGIISSIDWSHLENNKLLIHEASGKLSFLNTDTKRSEVYPETIVSAKTRFTPFGDGIIWTCRDEIGFISMKNSSKQIKVLADDSVITEYAWRVAGGGIQLDVDDRQFKLLTTGKHGKISELTFEPGLFQMIGHNITKTEATHFKQIDPVHDFVSMSRKAISPFPNEPLTVIPSDIAVNPFPRTIYEKRTGSKSLIPVSLYKSLENVTKNPKMIGKLEERLFFDGLFKGFWFSGTSLISFSGRNDVKKNVDGGMTFGLVCRNMFAGERQKSIQNAAYHISKANISGIIDDNQHRYLVKLMDLLYKMKSDSMTAHAIATSILNHIAQNSLKINNVSLFALSVFLQDMKPKNMNHKTKKNVANVERPRRRIPQSLAYKLRTHEHSPRREVEIKPVFKQELREQANNQFKDLLLRNQLFQLHAEFEKQILPASIISDDFALEINCEYCGNMLFENRSCTICKRKGSECVVCGLPADDLLSFCPECNHGGHTKHIMQWFSRNQLCPTGCGCACRTFTK